MAAAIFTRGVIETMRREAHYRRIALILTAAHKQFSGAQERRWIEDQMDYLCWDNSDRKSWAWYTHTTGEPLSRTGVGAAALKSLGVFGVGLLGVYAAAPALDLPSVSAGLGLLAACTVWAYARWSVSYQGITIAYSRNPDYQYVSILQEPSWVGLSSKRSNWGDSAALVLVITCGLSSLLNHEVRQEDWVYRTTQALEGLAASSLPPQAKIAQLARLEHTTTPSWDPALGIYANRSAAMALSTDRQCYALHNQGRVVCADAASVARAAIHVLQGLPHPIAACKALDSGQ